MWIRLEFNDIDFTFSLIVLWIYLAQKNLDISTHDRKLNPPENQIKMKSYRSVLSYILIVKDFTLSVSLPLTKKMIRYFNF
jgi:hypothetical protein